MKLRLLSLLAATLFAAVAARAESYAFKEPFTRTAPFNANGELSLENVNGAVEIHTWDKNEILIEGEKSAKTDEELRLIDLSIETSPTSAAIKVKLPKRSGGWFFGSNIRASVRFKLTVPARAVLRKIETVNASITLDGLLGSVHAATVNGRIAATGLGGDAKLETVNGSIRAAFASLAPGQHLACETVNGGITLALPKNAGAEVRASVVNGHIDCDFPIQLSAGRVGRGSLKGAIGDGRATLKAGTVNGSIHLESR
jgi:hypothetical protein